MYYAIFYLSQRLLASRLGAGCHFGRGPTDTLSASHCHYVSLPKWLTASEIVGDFLPHRLCGWEPAIYPLRRFIGYVPDCQSVLHFSTLFHTQFHTFPHFFHTSLPPPSHLATNFLHFSTAR